MATQAKLPTEPNAFLVHQRTQKNDVAPFIQHQDPIKHLVKYNND